MTKKWPSFSTGDLGDTQADSDEMMRRWTIYDREMRALIAGGRVHQDEDGWWVDDATGELIGPDPEIERPLSDADMKNMRPLKDAHPKLYKAIQRSRGRPPIDNPKEAVTLRLDPDVVSRFKARGKDWRTRMAKLIEKAS